MRRSVDAPIVGVILPTRESYVGGHRGADVRTFVEKL
jgi:hypothetical protein